MRPGVVWSARVIAAGWVVCSLPAIAYANHPAGRVDVWIGLLVFALVFLAVWVGSALIDRRRTLRARDRRKEARTS